jgi:hypothetical protein
VIPLEDLLARRDSAERAAHKILEGHEAAASRVVFLQDSFRNVHGLPVDVAAYYEEALRALGIGCYRAAMVLAWAGFIHPLTAAMVQRHGPLLTSHYPKWKTGSVAALLDSAPEAQILEAGKKVGLFSNQKLNLYRGWLTSRNQCAHPTLYLPSRNVALGFVDGIVSEVVLYI